MVYLNFIRIIEQAGQSWTLLEFYSNPFWTFLIIFHLTTIKSRYIKLEWVSVFKFKMNFINFISKIYRFFFHFHTSKLLYPLHYCYNLMLHMLIFIFLLKYFIFIWIFFVFTSMFYICFFYNSDTMLAWTFIHAFTYTRINCNKFKITRLSSSSTTLYMARTAKFTVAL